MSLYNMLHGMNPDTDKLLGLLGLTREDTGRFRDCYLIEVAGEPRIVIHTRNGGGNREDYQTVNDRLALHPNFLSDRDDEFDCTYADFTFSVPDDAKTALADIPLATSTPAERWQALFAALERRNG